MKQESYRLFAIKYLPRLRRLDGSDVTTMERTRADSLFANLDCARSPLILNHPVGVNKLLSCVKCLLTSLVTCSSSGEGTDDSSKDHAFAQEARDNDWDLSNASHSIRGRENTAPDKGEPPHSLDGERTGARRLAKGEDALSPDVSRRAQGRSRSQVNALHVSSREANSEAAPDGRSATAAAGHSASCLGSSLPPADLAARAARTRSRASVGVEAQQWELQEAGRGPGVDGHDGEDQVEERAGRGGTSTGSGGQPSAAGAPATAAACYASPAAPAPLLFRPRGGSEAMRLEQREARLAASPDQEVTSQAEARLAAALQDAQQWRSRALEAEAQLAAIRACPSYSYEPVPCVSPEHVAGSSRKPPPPPSAAAPVPAAQVLPYHDDKIDVPEMIARERQLVDMLRESHELLMSDAKRLREELDAERAARRKDADDFQLNWSQFESLRCLVQAHALAPATSAAPQPADGHRPAPDDSTSAAAPWACSYSVGCLPLSAPTKSEQVCAAPAPHPSGDDPKRVEMAAPAHVATGQPPVEDALRAAAPLAKSDVAGEISNECMLCWTLFCGSWTARFLAC